MTTGLIIAGTFLGMALVFGFLKVAVWRSLTSPKSAVRFMRKFNFSEEEIKLIEKRYAENPPSKFPPSSKEVWEGVWEEINEMKKNQES